MSRPASRDGEYGDDGFLGDLAGASRLGGLLRSRAASLVDLTVDLRGARPSAGQTRFGAELVATLDAIDAVAQRLDTLGSAVQAHIQESVLLLERRERLEQDVAARGLELHGWRVTEPWGLTDSAAAARRREALPELQAAADRVGAASRRARAQLQLACEQVQAELAATSVALRAGVR